MGKEMTRRSLMGNALVVGAGLVACVEPMDERDAAIIRRADEIVRRPLSALGRATGLKATACVECANLISTGPIWYSNTCGARRLPLEFDPMTGEQGDCGGECRHPFVRDVNDGNCRLFKAKGETEI